MYFRSIRSIVDYSYQLIITEGDDMLYLSLSSSEYKRIEDGSNDGLLRGEVTNVYAIIAKDRSLQDALSDRYRIMGLKSNSTVYYGLDAAKESLLRTRITWWIVISLFAIVWSVWTYIIVLMYDMIVIRKK